MAKTDVVSVASGNSGRSWVLDAPSFFPSRGAGNVPSIVTGGVWCEGLSLLRWTGRGERKARRISHLPDARAIGTAANFDTCTRERGACPRGRAD